jgi:Ca2+-binding RTX toxin-like protein
MGGDDFLFMTNNGDAVFITNSANVQVVKSVEFFFSGDSADVIDLAHETYTLNNLTVVAGEFNDLVWANVGDDLVIGGGGDDIIDGGPGHDQLFGDADNDKISGGAGDDTPHKGRFFYQAAIGAGLPHTLLPFR